MFPARYFPARYFPLRYWPKVGSVGAPATTIVLTTLEGRQLDIFADEVLAVEEQVTLVGDPVYQGVRSKVYLADHSFIVRSTAAATITLVQALDAFTATIVVTTVQGRQMTVLAGSIAATQEQLTDVRSPVYAGVRSRFYLENHAIETRLTESALITLIQAVVPFTATIVVTTVAGRQATILAAPIAAVAERLTDHRSPLYTGVRSRLYLEEHIIDVRLTSAALKTLIDAA